MPRPTTKEGLLLLSQSQYEKLLGFIDGLGPDQQARDEDLNGRDRNVRDVLCHLHGWHTMVHRWHDEGCAGGQPAVPGQGYTWRTIPALNRQLWQDSQATPLAQARRDFEASHALMQALVQGHSNDELFQVGIYRWTKSTTLGAYFVSATSSHYDWAWKTLRPLARR